MRNISEEFVEKIKTHILCSKTFSDNRTVNEIMWENIVELYWPQMTKLASHFVFSLIGHFFSSFPVNSLELFLPFTTISFFSLVKGHERTHRCII